STTVGASRTKRRSGGRWSSSPTAWPRRGSRCATAWQLWKERRPRLRGRCPTGTSSPRWCEKKTGRGEPELKWYKRGVDAAKTMKMYSAAKFFPETTAMETQTTGKLAAQTAGKTIPQTADKPRRLLDGYLTEAELAAELDYQPDTLRKWRARRVG